MSLITRIIREVVGEKPKTDIDTLRIKQLEAERDHFKNEVSSRDALTTAAETQINRAWKAYTVLAGLIGTFLLFVLGGAAFLGYSTYKQMLEDTRKSAEKQINNKISSEFETDRIRQTISIVASNQASQLLVSQIRPEVDRFGLILTNEINAVMEVSQQAFTNSLRLEQQAEFASVMNSAVAGSRSNYFQLLAWKNAADSPFSKKAERAAMLAAKLNFYNALAPQYTVTWKEGFDPQKATFAVLFEQYKSSPPHLRSPFVTTIWNRTDISKKIRMQFLLSVIENEEDLNAVFTAINYYSREAGLPASTDHFETYSDWWETNNISVK